MVFLDTNILLYAFDLHPESQLKRIIARELLLDRPHVSVQALTEFGAVRRRKCGEAPVAVAEKVTFLLGWCTSHDLSSQILLDALDLAGRYQLSHFDSLMVANALHRGGDVLLTEDLHSGLVIAGRLQILNPFV